MQTINDRLRIARQKSRLSQDAVAHLLGVSQCAYWKLENGKKSFDVIERLKKIAVLLEVEAGWLIFGEDE